MSLPLAKPADIGIDTTRFERACRLLEEWTKADKVPAAALCIGRRGKMIEPCLFGRQRPEANTPLRKDALFLVASITKPVTAVAVMMLVERGLLSQGYLTEPEQAIGQKLKRATVNEQVLAPVFLEQAEAVRRGDQVVIRARTGTVSVVMPGEALADGVPGQQIRVRNLSSQRVVKARVMEPGTVEVGM